MQIKSDVKPGRTIGRFLILYILLMGIALLLIGLEPVQKIVDINGVYSRGIVRLSAWGLAPFGIVEGISGSIIRLQGLALDVRFGCNGLEAFLIFAVAVAAFPAPARKKLVGVAAGFVLLQVVNVLRIAGLALVGIYLKDYFNYVHIYVAQGLMIAVALLLFLGWLNYATTE